MTKKGELAVGTLALLGCTVYSTILAIAGTLFLEMLACLLDSLPHVCILRRLWSARVFQVRSLGHDRQRNPYLVLRAVQTV